MLGATPTASPSVAGLHVPVQVERLLDGGTPRATRRRRAPVRGEDGGMAGVAGFGEGRGAAAVFTSTTVKPREGDTRACASSAAAIEEPLAPFPESRAHTTEATCCLGAAGPARASPPPSTPGARRVAWPCGWRSRPRRDRRQRKTRRSETKEVAVHSFACQSCFPAIAGRFCSVGEQRA